MNFKETNKRINGLLELNEILDERFKRFLTSLKKWNKTKELTINQIKALNNIEDYLRTVEINDNITINSESIY